MRKEIGSFYEWEEFKDVQGNTRTLSFLSEKTCTLLASGRDAIELLIKQVEGCNVNRVLLPAYTCDTIITPFEKAGFEIAFFHINERFEVLEKEFIFLVEQLKPQIILFHTYYGFDGFRGLRDCLKTFKNKGIIIVEDMTQSLFLKMDFQCVDYYVGSLRKWFPIADGGFLYGKKEESIPKRKFREYKEFVSLKEEAMHLKKDYLAEISDEKDTFLNLHRRAEDLLDCKQRIYGISRNSLERLCTVDFMSVSAGRSSNFCTLKQAIQDIVWIQDIMPDDMNITPLYVPVLIKGDRREIQEKMIEKDIFLPVLWPVPEQAAGYLNAAEQRIYESMLAIPCDQRYTAGDMQYVAECLRRARD